jgi:hypothetical protein
MKIKKLQVGKLKVSPHLNNKLQRKKNVPEKYFIEADILPKHS